jgi:hypothetical protein
MNFPSGRPGRDAARAASSAVSAKVARMAVHDQRVDGWTVVLRRQPVRLVEGQPESGFSDMFELICCDCGDDPDLDYREVSPGLRRVRGPYPIADGIAAYEQHHRLHPQPGVPAGPGTMADAG